MEFNLTTIIAFAFCALSHLTGAHANDKISEFLTVREQPKAIKRFAPKYPEKAALNRQEGWVQLSYVIEKDGSVSNALVIDSSGSKSFEREAQNALLKWQYEPVIENGEPIQRCKNIVQLDFRMSAHGEEKITKKFRRVYSKASNALTAKKFAMVKENIDILRGFKYLYLTENNYYHLLAANYQKALNNQDEELFHLSQIRFHNTNEQFNVYNRQFWLAVNLSLFRQAQSIFERINELVEAKPFLDNYVEVMTEVESIALGNESIVVSANMRKRGLWHYNLLRKAFSLTNISGKLHQLDVRCENKHYVYSIKENNKWVLPKSWGNCDLFISGDEDTRFNLIEHPLQS